MNSLPPLPLRHGLASLFAFAAIVVGGCGTSARPAKPTVRGVEALKTGVQLARRSLIFQPSLTRKGAGTERQGTGFLVEGFEHRLFAITSAHFVGFDGPPLERVDLLAVQDGRVLGGSSNSWGRPGAGGVAHEVIDLADDLLVLPLVDAPVGLTPISLSDEPSVAPGTRVWLPNKDDTQLSGYRRVEGTVTQNSLAHITVRLDEALPLQSQSGSPVLRVDDDVLVGVLSRGGEAEDGKMELLLTPGRYVGLAVSQARPVFALDRVAGAGGAGETVSMTFAWPVSQSLHIGKVQFKQKSGAPRVPVAGSYHYDSVARVHKPGIRVELRGFKLARGTEISTESRKMMEALSGAVPPMVIGPDGVFESIEDPQVMIDQLASTLGLEDGPQRTGMLKSLTPAFLMSVAAARWQHLVGAWAGASLEIGAVYVNDSEANHPLTGGAIPNRTYFSVTHRTACDPGDGERSCVVAWLSVEMNSEAMAAEVRKAVLANTPPERQAEARESLRGMTMESALRVSLITDPTTLIPQRFTREKYIQMPGQLRHEYLQERLLGIAVVPKAN